MSITRVVMVSAAALLLACSQCSGDWGLRFEVSKDGVSWSPSVQAKEDEVIKFRMSAYFDPGTPVSTTSASGTLIGTAIVWSRFSGQSQVSGMVAGDLIQNLVRVATQGNAALVSVSGDTIGTTSPLSFATQLLLPSALAPYVANPLLDSVIYRGEIKIGPSTAPRTLHLKNKSFGVGAQPGLRYYLNSADGNVGTPTAEAGPRFDVEGFVFVNSGSCDPVVVNSIGVISDGSALSSIVLVADVSSSADRFLWFHNGQALSEGGRFSGTRSKTLTVAAPTALDSGDYTLRSRSNCETVLSSPIAVTVPCSADLNADGVVNDDDFVLFANAYNNFSCPGSPSPCPADLNLDSVVDDADFMGFSTQYNVLLCSP